MIVVCCFNVEIAIRDYICFMHVNVELNIRNISQALLSLVGCLRELIIRRREITIIHVIIIIIISIIVI